MQTPENTREHQRTPENRAGYNTYNTASSSPLQNVFISSSPLSLWSGWSCLAELSRSVVLGWARLNYGSIRATPSCQSSGPANTGAEQNWHSWNLQISPGGHWSLHHFNTSWPPSRQFCSTTGNYTSSWERGCEFDWIVLEMWSTDIAFYHDHKSSHQFSFFKMFIWGSKMKWRSFDNK